MAKASNAELKRFTRECVYEAFFQLLETTEYEKITLSAIAVRAGVSRNAVYRNFEAKDQILKAYMKEFADSLAAEIKRENIASDEQYVTFLFTRLCAFRGSAKRLIALNMETLLLDAFLSMRDRFAVKTAYRDYYENCRIGAFFFIYLTWLENGCKESPEELCALVRQIVEDTF
ncbi:MAG: TetR/AcrR family transcriptional regulator [Clostridia bacterium]|nr:TetR/AcrR family transcriptional regulator [Clostridia bacterium]